uniref:VWFA domain-containing protein n=1 Tax=Acrobeloides nanus TaxID=290746 RepID=A0A914E2X2_9BILA
MGSANLRKISTVISLVMSKFTIGNRANISAGEHNTRVAVITYDHEARIVANFTDINSLGDLSTVLNKIQVSNTANANLYDRYAQCMNYVDGGFPDNYTELCTSDGLTPLAILSQDEENFVQAIWNDIFFYSSFYIGLHQDSKGNWVWYDDNMKEFSMTSILLGKMQIVIRNILTLDWLYVNEGHVTPKVWLAVLSIFQI